jgi:chromosome segregation ATPase
MTNGRKPPMPLTRGANLPPPVGHNSDPTLEGWGEEAGRAAQRFFDLTAQCARLQGELEEWRRRAQLAEEENRRGQDREKAMADKLDAMQQRLTEERDSYKDRLTALKAEFAVAGNIILRCVKTADDMTTGRPEIDLDRLTAEIEEELPRVVQAGPRED